MKILDLKQLLKDEGIYLTKKRGQNFLIDQNIIASILKQAGVQETQSILEIGTGLGFLTEALLNKKAHVISYEMDQKIFHAASNRLKNFTSLSLIHEDFLKADFAKRISFPCRVISNIPYNIASQILIRLWLFKEFFEDIYVLVQKEFGERIKAEVPCQKTGFLSIILQNDFKITKVRAVPAQAFYPVPHVDSVYLKLKPIPSKIHKEKRRSFFLFVKECFSQRRKKVFPRLVKVYKQADRWFEQLMISKDIRAEMLTMKQWELLWLKMDENRL